MDNSSQDKQPFNLSRWAIGHPSIARFLFGLIIVTGALGLMRMGQSEDPEFTFRVMVVQAVWPGASIEEMQDQVVNKIERKLQETPHLDWVKSYTRAGSAIITVQVKGDTNTAEVKDAFYQVRKKVGDISSELPQGLLGPYFGSDSLSLHVQGDVAQFSRGNQRDGTEIWVDETGAGGVARRACRNQHGSCIS